MSQPWIVIMPEEWEPGHYPSCPFHCDYCRREAQCSSTCPLANAKKAVEVNGGDIDRVFPDKILAHGKTVTLYSVGAEK